MAAKKSLTRWIMSMVCVLGMVGTWVMTAFFVQGLQTPGKLNYYPKPFFINWFVTSGYTLLFLVFFPGRLYQLHTRKKEANQILMRYGGKLIVDGTEGSGTIIKSHAATLHAYEMEKPNMTPAQLARCTEELKGALSHLEETYFTKEHKRLTLISSLLMVVYVGSGYLWYVSLPRTPLSANTVIYNSACVIVFCLSIVILGEKVSILKVSSVTLALAGVISVALLGSSEDTDEENEASSELLGYLCVFISVFLYAVYQVLFKALSGEEDDVVEDVVTMVPVTSQTVYEGGRYGGTGESPLTGSGTPNTLGLSSSIEVSGASTSNGSKEVSVASGSTSAQTSGEILQVAIAEPVERNGGMVTEDEDLEVDEYLDEAEEDELDEELFNDMGGLDDDEVPQDALSEILSASFVLGCIGITNILLMWPFIILIDIINVEPWDTPNKFQLEQLFLNLFLSTSLNSFLLVGILFTTPLFMSIGQLLTIPSSVLLDALVNNTYLTLGQTMGALLLVVGFVGLNVSDVLTGKDDDFQNSTPLSFIWKEHHVQMGFVTRALKGLVGIVTCRSIRRMLRHKRGYYTQTDSTRRRSRIGSERKTSQRRGSLDNTYDAPV